MKQSIKTEQSIFDNLYIFFFLLLPLIFFSNIIVDPVLLPRQILLSIFLLIISGLIISRKALINKSVSFNFKSVLLPLFLIIFLIFQIISIQKAIDLKESIYVISKTSVLIAFLLITTILLINGKLQLKSIIKGVIIMTLIVELFACYQFIDVLLNSSSFWEGIHDIKSTIANKNLLSSFLFISIPFLFGAIIINRQWRRLSIIIFIVNLILILFLQTRAVWLSGMFFAMILLFTYFGIRKKSDNKTATKSINKDEENISFSITFIILLFLLSLTEIGIIAYNYQYSDVKKSGNIYTDSYTAKYPAFTLADNTHTFKARKNLWRNSIEMLKEYPVRGVGAGNWQILFPKYGLTKFSKIVFSGNMTSRRPHNDYLWIFCESGIFSLLTYIAIFLLSLFYLSSLILNASDIRYKMLYVFMFAGVIGYMVISFFDFPLERIEHQVMIFTIFSIVLAAYIKQFKVQSLKLKANTSLINIILIPVILFSIIVSSYRLNGEMHTFQLMKAHKKGDWNNLIKESRLADNIFYDMDPMTMPVSWYEGVGNFALNKIDSATICFEKSYKIHPYNVNVLNNLGSCYEQKERHDDAIVMYKKALDISPKFAESLLNLSATYYNQEKYEEAFQTISRCKINTMDEKYSIFLPAILNKKLELIKQTYTDEKIKSRLSALQNNNTEMVSLFKDSKVSKTDFETYIREWINEN